MTRKPLRQQRAVLSRIAHFLDKAGPDVDSQALIDAVLNAADPVVRDAHTRARQSRQQAREANLEINRLSTRRYGTSQLPGLPALTPVERVALTAVAIGLTQPVAARRLETSERNLRRKIDTATRRLGAVTAVHAVALAVADGQLDPTALQARALEPWPAPTNGDT